MEYGWSLGCSPNPRQDRKLLELWAMTRVIAERSTLIPTAVNLPMDKRP